MCQRPPSLLRGALGGQSITTGPSWCTQRIAVRTQVQPNVLLLSRSLYRVGDCVSISALLSALSSRAFFLYKLLQCIVV